MHWSIRRTLAVTAAGGLCLAGSASAVAAPDPGQVGSQNSSDTGTVYADPDPYFDGCANHANPTVKMSGQNIGGASITDYNPHHNPFEYYASTATQRPVRPSADLITGACGPAWSGRPTRIPWAAWLHPPSFRRPPPSR